MIGFNYILLNPRSLPQTYVELFNRVYDHWISDHSENSSYDRFMQADHIAVITYRNQPVAFQILQQLDLRLKPSWFHPTLRTLAKPGQQYLRSLKSQQLLLSESLHILPEWKDKALGFSWEEILVSLSLRLLDDSAADLMLSQSASGVFSELCLYQDVNAVYLQIYAKQFRRHFENPLIEEWVNALWPLSEPLPVKVHSVQ